MSAAWGCQPRSVGELDEDIQALKNASTACSSMSLRSDPAGSSSSTAARAWQAATLAALSIDATHARHSHMRPAGVVPGLAAAHSSATMRQQGQQGLALQQQPEGGRASRPHSTVFQAAGGRAQLTCPALPRAPQATAGIAQPGRHPQPLLPGNVLVPPNAAPTAGASHVTAMYVAGGAAGGWPSSHSAGALTTVAVVAQPHVPPVLGSTHHNSHASVLAGAGPRLTVLHGPARQQPGASASDDLSTHIGNGGGGGTGGSTQPERLPSRRTAAISVAGQPRGATAGHAAAINSSPATVAAAATSSRRHTAAPQTAAAAAAAAAAAGGAAAAVVGADLLESLRENSGRVGSEEGHRLEFEEDVGSKLGKAARAMQRHKLGFKAAAKKYGVELQPLRLYYEQFFHPDDDAEEGLGDSSSQGDGSTDEAD